MPATIEQLMKGYELDDVIKLRISENAQIIDDQIEDVAIFGISQRELLKLATIPGKYLKPMKPKTLYLVVYLGEEIAYLLDKRGHVEFYEVIPNAKA